MQHPASALLFDNDGVLSDSIESVDASWGEWASIYAPDFQISYEHHGIRAEELVAKYVKPELYEEALNKMLFPQELGPLLPQHCRNWPSPDSTKQESQSPRSWLPAAMSPRANQIRSLI
jgi:hypothetical protein